MSQQVESRELTYLELNPLERFGFNITNLIKQRKLADETIAQRAGMSVEELIKIRTGKLPLEELAPKISGISKGLGVNEVELGRLLTSELLE